MEELAKAIFEGDLKFIKEICKKNNDCDDCILHDKYCMILGEVPEHWDEKKITERAFRK